MRIVRYESGGTAGIGMEHDGIINPLDFKGDMMSLIESYPDAVGVVDLARGDDLSAGEVRILAPIRRPGKIVCLGRNYAAHAAESGMSVPDEPIIFPKASSSVIGQGEAIVHHRICTRVDHEVELAVIIGKSATRVGRKEALDRVFGYTVINDVSARDMQKRDLELRNPWFRSKSLDTFCPMGPGIVTRDEIGNPQDLSLECRVDSQVRQRGNTRDMIFPVDRLIEFISLHMTLEPGDIISTGTPEGISAIVPGDTVVCEVEGVGTLSNPVVADTGP